MRKLGTVRNACRIAAATLALSAFPSCGMIQQEPPRMDARAMDAAGAEALGFRKGKTDVYEAEQRMKSHGLTGIASAGMPGKGGTLRVLAADYQDELHIFVGEVYAESVRLRCGAVPPYGFALTFASSKSGTFLLALYRDPLEMVPSGGRGMAPEPPRIDVFRLEGGSFTHGGTLRLAKLSKSNGGLTDPLFVGNDLDSGILFIARGSGGSVWQKAYLLGMKAGADGEPHIGIVGSVPRDKAAGCSCVENYIYGKSSE